MKIDMKRLKKVSDLSKLESAPPSVLKATAEQQNVTAIIRVKEPNYVPPQIRERARIDPLMFTSVFPSSLLSELESDPKVESVALTRPQKIIK